MKKDKEGHYLIIKGFVQEEDIAIINMYVPYIGAPRYIQKNTIRCERRNWWETIIVGDFNNPLTSMDRSPPFLEMKRRSSIQKISKVTEILNYTIEKLDLIDNFQDITAKKIRIHILFKCTGNILKDWLHTWAQN